MKAATAQTLASARKATVTRGELPQSAVILGLMMMAAVPAGIDVTFVTQDVLVGVMAGAVAALLLVALLQMLGVLGGH